MPALLLLLQSRRVIRRRRRRRRGARLCAGSVGGVRPLSEKWQRGGGSEVCEAGRAGRCLRGPVRAGTAAAALRVMKSFRFVDDDATTTTTSLLE